MESERRRPLGSLHPNVKRGPGGHREAKKASFAEADPQMISPEPQPASRAETEERKSAFVSRTREAGQTPYKYDADADEGKRRTTDSPAKDGIFTYDYSYNSDVKPKVNRRLQIYEDGVGDGNDCYKVVGKSDGRNGEGDNGVALVEKNAVERMTSKEYVASPTQSVSPSVPPEKCNPTLDSPVIRSVQREPESSPPLSLVGTKTSAGITSDDNLGTNDESNHAPLNELSTASHHSLSQAGENETTRSSLNRESPASGKKSPLQVSGPSSLYESGASPPQREQSQLGNGELSGDSVATKYVISERKNEDKGTIASSVELPTERAQRRVPLATPSKTHSQQQPISDYVQDGPVSFSKPRMGGRRGAGPRNASGASFTSSTASHLHRPDRPDRESIPRPEPVHSRYKFSNLTETFYGNERKAQPVHGPNDEEMRMVSHSQPPPPPSINESDVMWTNDDEPHSNLEAYKKENDHSVNYSMSREVDDEFRSLNDLMESFMLRTQDNYFYCRDDKVVVQQQQKQVLVTKNSNKKQLKKAKKSVLGPPLRVFSYGDGVSPDSSAVDDSLFGNSHVDEAAFHFGHNAPYLGQAISSPVKAARDGPENDLDMTAMTASTTTMSVVDNSCLDDSMGGEAVIAFSSKRELDDGALSLEEDMKEVTLSCSPLDFTTLVLTFRNQRKRPMNLKSSAILVRFDKLGQFWDENKSSCNQSSLLAPSGSVFQVSPRVLKLDPGARANLYVTFSPNQESQGIYSGALKIKSSGKTFVLLLRGEARRDGPDRTLLEGPDMADASIQTDLDCGRSAHETLKSRMIDTETKFENGVGRSTSANLVTGEPSLISHYSSTTHFGGEQPRVDEVAPPDENVMENVSYRGQWLRNWLKKERGTHDDEDCDLISVTETITLDSDGHGMLSIGSRSSLPVVVELKLSSGNLSISDTRATIKPLGEFSVSMFTTALSQYSDKSEHFSPTKCHVGFLTITSIDDQKDYIVDIRRGYQRSPNNTTVSTTSGAAPVFTPHKAFLWPSVTQPLGTVDRVSRTLQLETPLRELPPSSRSVFFRTSAVHFRGPLGMLARERVDLCNTTDHQMGVRIEDPDLPFVLLHNEISIEAKSYVSVPIRFVPVSRRDYASTLRGRSLDGDHSFSVALVGAPGT